MAQTLSFFSLHNGYLWYVPVIYILQSLDELVGENRSSRWPISFQIHYTKIKNWRIIFLTYYYNDAYYNEKKNEIQTNIMNPIYNPSIWTYYPPPVQSQHTCVFCITVNTASTDLPPTCTIEFMLIQLYIIIYHCNYLSRLVEHETRNRAHLATPSKQYTEQLHRVSCSELWIFWTDIIQQMNKRCAYGTML